MSSQSEDEVMDVGGGLEDDLFGSEDGEEENKVRELSDRELDSGDDDGRSDRAPEREPEEADYDNARDARILDTTVWKHGLPRPVDGQFNTLRLPKFLAIEPRAFDPDAFELPVADHHSNTKSVNFSASATANSTIRYRKKPTTGELESNTVIYKWSDGSTTISVGDEHYEMQTKPLAPPRDSKSYLEVQDSHEYVASPSIACQLLVMVGHMTNQYTVRPNKNIEDDALAKLQRSLAAATRGGNKGEDKNGPQVIANTQDPELQKKRAEVAEKERMKLQRRRETAAEKALLPSGIRRAHGGLNVDDLEGRGRRNPATGRKPARKARKADYDSDDDDLPRGRNREDEYDKDDGFLADSDEEEEIVEDDDEEEIESEVEEPRRKKQKKAPREDDLSDADADADGDIDIDADAEADLDDEEAPTAANEPRGRKGRNIIEDDDDDE